MTDRAKGAFRKLTLLVLVAALFGTLFTVAASANNLDRQTAQDFAREIARKDCQQTAGCESYRAVGLHRVSRHKAVGKISVISEKNGERFDCRRQLVMRLDHLTGDLDYAVSQRKCTSLGPA